MYERGHEGNNGQRELKMRKRVSRRRGSSHATERLSKIRTEKCPLALAISRSFVTTGTAISVEQCGVGARLLWAEQ